MEATKTYPVLVTSPSEWIEHLDSMGTGVGSGLDTHYRWLLENISDNDAEYIARKIGDYLMQGGSYWEAVAEVTLNWLEAQD